MVPAIRRSPFARPRRALGTLLCFACPFVAQAQQSEPISGARRSAWYMYFGDHPLTENWSVHLEGQFRREDLGQRWEQLLLRPGVSRSFGHGISSLVAYTYLRDYPYEGGSLDSTTTGPQPEHRLLEEFKVKHTLISGPSKATSTTLTHRLRAEQRFEGTATLGVGVTDWQYAERARYRLTANIPFRWASDDPRPDYTSVYNEVFVNFGPHGGSHALNQDRTYGALGWNLGPSFQLEVGYLFQYMPTPNGVVGTQNHALQVTLNSIAPFRHILKKK